MSLSVSLHGSEFAAALAPDQNGSAPEWLNPPEHWSCSEDGLTLSPAAKTDLWQGTHYGFRVDNAPVLLWKAPEDFVMETSVQFTPLHHYDQAGLMVRVSPQCWLKTSAEFIPEKPAHLGSVVTNAGWSDWAVQDYALTAVSLRITRTGQDYIIEWRSEATADWTLMRICHLHTTQEEPVMAGLYACSPQGAGYRATFQAFSLSARPAQT